MAGREEVQGGARTNRERGRQEHRRCRARCETQVAELAWAAAPSKVGAVCDGIDEEDECDDAEGVNADGDDGEGHG
jgi:hypothetical protein